MKEDFSPQLLFRIWLCFVTGFPVLWYFPYIDFPIRVVTWLVGMLILAGLLVICWRSQFLRYLLILTYSALILVPFLPSRRAADSASLQTAYCSALKSYEGTRYVWGGEGCLAIDCSGLVRKALEDALAGRGIATRDPGLLRACLALYWHDTNAKTIGEGYGGRTWRIVECPSLNALDYSLVKTGDLAVTARGDHVMAYLGDRTWIAADPGVGKVKIFSVPERTNAYFSMPMQIVRWKILSE